MSIVDSIGFGTCTAVSTIIQFAKTLQIICSDVVLAFADVNCAELHAVHPVA